MVSPFLRVLCGSICLVGLTGCNPFWGLAPSSSNLQDSGWAWVDEKPTPDQTVCYRTLGQVQCQVMPTSNPLDEERRVGSFTTNP